MEGGTTFHFVTDGIEVALAERETCCGMPKLELGDLQAVERLKDNNIPQLLAMIGRGYDIVAPIPSCVLMFKQELPLMFPDDADVAKVRDNMFDPFEYLALRHKAGLLRMDFARPLGKVSYHVACHLRVQNIGLKTRDVLQLIPGTTVEAIERCSGHNGTYGVKREFRDKSLKIGKPVMQPLMEIRQRARANLFHLPDDLVDRGDAGAQLRLDGRALAEPKSVELLERFRRGRKRFCFERFIGDLR